MKKKIEVNSPEFRNIVTSISSRTITLPPLPKKMEEDPQKIALPIPTVRKKIEKEKDPQLPKDVSEVMANNLTPQDLVNLCSSETRPDFKRLCDNNDFWTRRWKKDFSVLINSPFYNKSDARNRYLQLFSNISQGAEEVVSLIFNNFGDFSKFLHKEYKDTLYLYFYNRILYILNVTSRLDIDEEYFHNHNFGNSNLQDFKKYLPEFLRKDRNYFYDEWYFIFERLGEILIQIIKKLQLFKLRPVQIPSSPKATRTDTRSYLPKIPKF